MLSSNDSPTPCVATAVTSEHYVVSACECVLPLVPSSCQPATTDFSALDMDGRPTPQQIGMFSCVKSTAVTTETAWFIDNVTNLLSLFFVVKNHVRFHVVLQQVFRYFPGVDLSGQEGTRYACDANDDVDGSSCYDPTERTW